MSVLIEGAYSRVPDDETLEPGRTARLRPELGSNEAILAMAEILRSHPNFTDIVRKSGIAKTPNRK